MKNRQRLYNGMGKASWIAGAVMIALLLLPTYVQAASGTYTVKKSSAAVRSEPSSGGEVLGEVHAGTEVRIHETKGDWAKVSVNGRKGFMNRGAFQSESGKSDAKEPDQSEGNSVLKLQKRLNSKGYLSKSGVTGNFGSGTARALKVFQLENGLSITGEVNSSTIDKLFSSSARSKKSVSNLDWTSGKFSSVLPRKGTATILDIKTGTRIAIRRVGGVNHADVEPKTASDTAKLKRVYGGSWSWDSRPVILIAGGKYICAAINGMPHGDEISTTNNFKGQFCLHTLNSKTHGTDCVQSEHQSSIREAYDYFN